jgi:hypothetical protein
MFWGNSPHNRSIFITQKRIVRIITKAKPKDSCKEMFSKLGILTLYSQYIISIPMFVVKYKDLFAINTELHKYLHIPLVSLTKVQKGVYYSCITLFNSLSAICINNYLYQQLLQRLTNIQNHTKYTTGITLYTFVQYTIIAVGLLDYNAMYPP